MGNNGIILVMLLALDDDAFERLCSVYCKGTLYAKIFWKHRRSKNPELNIKLKLQKRNRDKHYTRIVHWNFFDSIYVYRIKIVIYWINTILISSCYLRCWYFYRRLQ